MNASTRSGASIHILAALVVAAACEAPRSATDSAATTAPAGGPAATASGAQSGAQSGALPLPIPVNAVMVSMVDFAADGLWRPAAQEFPMTEQQWKLAEKDALDLIASATLITTAGTGVNDTQWVEDADWRRWSFEMQQVAIAARDAVARRDQGALKTAGDQLIDICQACHLKFKPDLPSMGITRFPVYPKYPETVQPPEQ